MFAMKVKVITPLKKAKLIRKRRSRAISRSHKAALIQLRVCSNPSSSNSISPPTIKKMMQQFR